MEGARLPPRAQVHTQDERRCGGRRCTLFWAPPTTQMTHAWMAARDKEQSRCRSVQADAYTVHYHYNMELVGSGERGLFALPTALIPLPMLCRPRIAMAPSPTDEFVDLPRSVWGLRKTINSRRPEIAAVQQNV